MALTKTLLMIFEYFGLGTNYYLPRTTMLTNIIEKILVLPRVIKLWIHKENPLRPLLDP